MKSRRDSRNGPSAATAVPSAVALEGERQRFGQGNGDRAQMRTQSGVAGEKKTAGIKKRGPPERPQKRASSSEVIREGPKLGPENGPRFAQGGEPRLPKEQSNTPKQFRSCSKV